MSKPILWAVGILVLIGGGIFIQWQTKARLSYEVAAARDENREAARLREQRQTMEAAAIPPEELATLRAEHDLVERLRLETDALQKKTEAAARAPVTDPKLEAPERSITNSVMPATSWRNVGRATPVAAIETALWAAAAGDTETLAGMLRLNAAGRARAGEILAALPDSAREQYDTPEHMLALLLAKEVPLGGAGITGQSDTGNEAVANLNLRLVNADGLAKNINVNLFHQPDGWQLVVPEKAVENYGAKLAGKPPPWPEKPWRP